MDDDVKDIRARRDACTAFLLGDGGVRLAEEQRIWVWPIGELLA